MKNRVPYTNQNMSKRFVILGGGESGVGAELLAKKNGYEVFLSDGSSLKDDYRSELKSAGIEFAEGRHTDDRILNGGELIKCPGMSEKADIVNEIRSK